MADPFASFPDARPRTAPPGGDPFASFPDANRVGSFAQPAVNKEPELGIDWNLPREDVRKAINLLPADMKSKAYQQWAKSEVGAERKAGKTADFMYNLTAGTPVGSWLDEGEGLLQSGINKITGGRFGRPYDETVAVERERQKQAEDNSPLIGTLPYIGEVRGSGFTKLAGGLLSAPISPVVNAFKGATILPQMGNAMATGAAYGGLYGAGEGDSAGDRAGNAAMGAAAGAGLGAAIVPMAKGAGNAIAAIQRRAQPMPSSLSGFERGAVDRVAAGMNDDKLLVGRYVDQRKALGPEGMLADMGQNLQSQAGAIANQPGAGKRILTEGIEGRREGAPGRITSGLNQAIGEPVNVPEFVETFMKRTKADAKPFYEAFYQAEIPPSPELALMLNRSKALGVFDKAARLMEIEGLAVPGMGPKSPAMTQRELSDAAQIRANMGNISPGEADSIFDMYRYVNETMRKPPPESLSGYLHRVGGLQNQGGEIKNILGSARGRPGFMNNRGLTLDDAADKAYQEGFFSSRPSIREFLDVLDDDLKGTARVVRDNASREMDDARIATEMIDELGRLGIDPKMSATTLRQALGLPTDRPIQSNTGQFLDLIKRGIDDVGRDAKPGSNEDRLFKGLSAQFRDEVDRILVNQGAVAMHPKTGQPASVWAVARHHAGEGLSARDAIEQGQKAFSTGVHPDQMRMDMKNMNVPQTEAFTVGARDWVRSKMGNASAAYGPNGDVAARRALQSEFAGDKMKMITTKDRAAELDRVLKAESTFADTENTVLRNSMTADRQAAQKMYPVGGDAATRGAQIGQRSAVGAVFEATYRIANTLAGGAIDERRMRIAENAARMLIAQGAERDTIARGLAQYMSQKNMNAKSRAAISGLIEKLSTGARPLTVDRVISDQPAAGRR